MSHFATTTLKGKLSALQKIDDKLVIGRSNGFIEIIERHVNASNKEDIREGMEESDSCMNKTFFEDIQNEVYDSCYSFQSHTAEFDYLESNEISEKISIIENINIGDFYMNILTGNEKTIKLWNVRNNESEYNSKIDNEVHSNRQVKLGDYMTGDRPMDDSYNESINNKASHEQPANNRATIDNKAIIDYADNNKANKECIANRVTLDFNTENILPENPLFFNVPKKGNLIQEKKCTHFLYNEYKNAHQYTMNDIKCFENTNTFLSCDYLRINFWDVEYMHKYNLIDIKPQKYDDLTFVITNLYTNKNMSFFYSTSKGEVFYQDMRICPKSKACKTFTCQISTEEVLKSICQIQVIDNVLATRDLESVNLFDIRNEKLIKSFDLLKKKNLESLIESGAIYEKIRMKKNDNYLITGGFDSKISIINVDNLHLKEIDVETDFIKHVEFFDNGFVYGNNNNLYFYR